MELIDDHFIKINLNWSKSGYATTYFIKFEEIAQEYIANLAHYLHKADGNSILKSLSVEMQALINECVWDEKIGRQVTKLDMELDDILKQGIT